MTNEQILKKAIKKAVLNGWGGGKYEWERLLGLMKDEESPLPECQIWGIIFSHSFAKAFWGSEGLCMNCGCVLASGGNNCLECDSGHFSKVGAMWQWHLQQMVLEKDPIKYLEKFLTKKEVKND